MSVALGIQHAVRMRSIIFSSMLFYIALHETCFDFRLECGIFVVKLFAKDVGMSLILISLKTL